MATLVASAQVDVLYSAKERDAIFPNSFSSIPAVEQRHATYNRPYHLSRAQVELYKRNGYLILRDLLTSEETANIIAWTNEVKSWDGKTTKVYLQYDETTEEGTVRCSSEVRPVFTII